MIVLDASATVELVLQRERGRRVELRVLDPRERLYAPQLLDLEVAQVLRRLLQAKAISSERAREALDDYAALSIERQDHRALLPRVWQLRSAVTAYDAAYLALAEALDAPLLTCDGKLARAHGHRARIELVR